MTQGYKGAAKPRGTCPHPDTRLIGVDYDKSSYQTQCLECGALFAGKMHPRIMKVGRDIQAW